MLLTLDTSPTIVRRHTSRVKKEIHFAYVSLSPSPGTASPVNHLSCKAIDSFVGVVTRRPTASAPLPKPPDPWHSEPREPPPPDPPPCPPDPPFKAHRTPSPLTEPQNNHPNDSSLSTNSSRAKSDVNPAHSRWRWSPASALAALGHDDQDGDPTRKPSPSINPPCISSPVVAQKLAGGLTRKSPPLFQSVLDCFSLRTPFDIDMWYGETISLLCIPCRWNGFVTLSTLISKKPFLGWLSFFLWFFL